MEKLPYLIKKLPKSYCRLEVYFEVDSAQKLTTMKNRIIKQIEKLQYIGVQSDSLQTFLQDYIFNLNNLLSLKTTLC